MHKLKLLLTCFLSLFIIFPLFAQNRTIKGKVLNDGDKSAIVGATVSVKGGSKATTTDAEGSFSLAVPSGRLTLVVSSVGFSSKEISVSADETSVSAELTSTTQQLNEVVVTALGITKSKRTLNYATQTVEMKDITKARETNVANSLAGRVAGLDIVRSSQGVGSEVRVVLRGDRSFGGSSEALIIIDGIPGDLGTLNSDDIASMNVLKGSSASALYGSNAQNGAIIIATKKGVAGKGLAIGINSSAQFDKAVNLRSFQNEYAQGSNGNYLKDAEGAWGPKMTGQSVENWSIDPADAGSTYALTPHPNNYQDFFSVGKTFTNGFSVGGGNDKIQSYFSYNNVSASGIIDNNGYRRHNFNFRVTGNLTDKLSFDTKVTYTWQKADNFVRSDENFTNVNRQIIRLPSNIDIDYAKSHYQFVNSDGELKQNYWHPHSNGGENPFWVQYNVGNAYTANVIRGLGSLTYKFLPSLSLMVRTGVTKFNSIQNEKRNFDTYVMADNGYFNVATGGNMESNTDFLLSYNKLFGDFSVSAYGGGNMKYSSGNTLSSTAYPLVNENVFTLNNAGVGALTSTESQYERRKNSLYAAADVSYKSILTASITGRNDVTSTLPKNNWSYFFGSAGLTAVISEMVTLPGFISFLKLRGSIAQTGNDADAYLTQQYYSISPGGSISNSDTKIADTLKPEMTTAQEFGVELNLFKNRVGLEVTYYNTNSKNQLVKVAAPPASGFPNRFINSGNVQNRGIEITMNITPVRTTDFSWVLGVNYAKNNNKVLSIAPNSPELVLRTDFINLTKIVEGRPYGEMYSRGLLIDSATGQQIVQDDGKPAITGASSVYLGNSRPKWTGGLSNKFTYKAFSLSALVSARMGGRVTSFTDAVIYGDGLSSKTLEGRDGFIVKGIKADKQPNTTTITAEEYWNQLGGRNTPVGELFTYSSSNIRLREVVLSYTIPASRFERTPIKGATISLTGRNLFFFMNDAKGFDPELAVSTDKGSIGTESFCLPYSRSLGINLNLNF